VASTSGAPQARDEIRARLSRIEGQVRGISRMISEGRPCADVLPQLRSAIHALCRVQDQVLDQHLRRCVRESFEGGGSDERERKAAEILALLGRYREP
jgi:DNA-binding FrmR family transcriptional regulator